MRVLRIAIVVCLVACALAPAQTAPREAAITIDAHAPATPFPHYWERMFGSGRAILSLRDSYRRDLREVKGITGLQYVRFHAIFHDEVGVYDEDAQGNPVYNWSYVDQIYDGLLANGVRPFVELSFMPRKLAAKPDVHAFWYKPDPAPPKDYKKWDELIYRFARHLVERYGEDEVAKWYFEVWNEPNIDFWTGDPKEPTYYQLYDETARSLKRASARIRVGGPATAQAAWVDRFIAHCAQENVPVDFVSTHVYANDTADNVFGTKENIPRDQMVCRAVKKVHDQVKASARPNLPIEWSEYNASYMNEPTVTDTIFMGPWLADTIRQCDGLVDNLAYWTFSDVFEEQGVVKKPFYGGFGLEAAGSLPKPVFNAFKLLHRLGDERLKVDSDSVLATRRPGGSLAIAVWNYSAPEQPGAPRTIMLRIAGTKAASAMLSRVDADHGNVLAAYEKMGSPQYPTSAQIQQLRAAAQLGAPEKVTLKNGTLQITLPPKGLALLELR